MTARPTSPAEAGPLVPGWDHEREMRSRNYSLIAGVDEAGRGAWAGPLVAGAVVLPHPDELASGERAELLKALCRLRDSKLLSPEVREELLPVVEAVALATGVGIVSPALVDLIGLGPANRLAMVRAVRDLGLQPEFVLTDAFKLPQLPIPHRPIIRGDACCMSIAAASIVAKVTRDRMMQELDAAHPGYHFGQHKGYGTPDHIEALKCLGVSPLHRRSYAPIKALLNGQPVPG